MAQKPPQNLVLPNYPYLKKFDPAKVAEALDRKDKLVDLLTDPVGPDGTVINVPMDMLHILAFHLAYAGADVHTDHRQLIEYRVRADPERMFEMYEWRPKGTFDDEPEPEAEPDGEAVTIAAQMRQQLTPEVREALAQILADEFAAARRDTDISPRERAEQVLIEQREIRDKLEDNR
jgi:hypothetical protein